MEKDDEGGLAMASDPGGEGVRRQDCQQLRAPTALTEDPNSIPSTHIRLFPTASNSSSTISDTFIWPVKAMQIQTQTNTHPKQIF